MPRKIPNTIIRGGVYYLNLKIPKDLHELGAYDGKPKITETLDTKEYRVANNEAPIRVGRYKEEFATIRQRYEETGSIELSAKDKRKRRSRGALATNESPADGECCFLHAASSSEGLAEQFAREYFISLIKASEASVEESYTKSDFEAIDSLYVDACHEIEHYGAGTSREQGIELVTGERILSDYLDERGVSYSTDGLQLVAKSHDKFRRAALEVAKRTHARIKQILKAKRLRLDAGLGWTERFDSFFADLSAYEGVNAGSPAIQQMPMQLVSSGATNTGMTLQQLCHAYMKKQRNLTLAAKSLNDSEGICTCLLASLSPDFILSEFDDVAAIKVVDFISRLPKGIKVKGLTPAAFRLRVQGVLDTDNEYKVMSERTYHKKCTQLRSIFRYAVSDHYKELQRSPFTLFDVSSHINNATPNGEGREVLAFTIEQLNALFSRPIYTGHGKGVRKWNTKGSMVTRDSGRYWAPLLMLFHGCRLNEAAQLMPNDIDVEAEIPFLRISEAYGLTGKERTPKSLKNKNSERLVPIHPELIKCGFLEFVKQRKREGFLWLFPEWTHETLKDWKRGDAIPKLSAKHSDRASDHCLKLRDTVVDSLAKNKPCNHSFRHMVRTALRVAEVDNKTAEVLQGWSDGKGTMGDNYGLFTISLLYKSLSKVSYEGLDISHLYVKPSRRRRSE